ncbi:Protein N-acetyltransferase, RimJ/RimL family [Paenibacillus sophorae]|uniref:GNAT family N-acetyltransferase n=1 Tax=Paenibacillus sophorae TaxID=1333845 RepID=A0A1H8FW85_9BACL|nr:GNAT family N-acetyltransferase [Paenibacillus sophorae]QWU14005.1 GNAT family N-acetyltransferase [Paenibacillus sophorae]SEN35986.1 Protein N-acetyltransferase, RimJ/RimL family [Paenibacillus sophorae]
MSLPITGDIHTSLGKLNVVHADSSMAGEVLKLLREAAQWMRDNGLTQWKPEQFKEEDILNYFNEREVYIAMQGGVAAGMFTLQFGDPQYWGRRNDESFAYLHRLAVAMPFRGAGLGSKLLKFAAEMAKASGRSGLRLDTIADNVKLNRYYQSQGFRYMGTHDVGGGRLVNLYEKMETSGDKDAIRLQYFDAVDFECLRRWSVSPDFLKQWAGPSLHFPIQDDELRKYLDGANHPAESELMVYSAVHMATDTVIGHLSLAGIDRDNGSARIGRVILDPEYRGKGFARRMIGEAMRIGFESLELHRLALGVFDFNTSAIRTYEALGFRREGEHLEAARFSDRYANLIDMAMLDREWSEMKHNMT